MKKHLSKAEQDRQFHLAYAMAFEGTPKRRNWHNIFSLWFSDTNCVKNFYMPIRVTLDGEKPRLLDPTERWQSITDTPGRTFSVDRSFYVQVQR